ncbi:hypothetical protein BDV27DRAFT_163624 [Aspergillus caelatus]|uniref:Uncharacterized protein n=1 Tax=Aspergillus caelatus TaxID=61420 RepID=A0A5N6ZL93_9EURO|nr:uncharacterized protein BDV27DRAFT_163624 [Aspergillus caelatus]KAE8358394.1 hypothetical protein BDV27DRAFT_163624 [Aspergillus caelatus]
MKLSAILVAIFAGAIMAAPVPDSPIHERGIPKPSAGIEERGLAHGGWVEERGAIVDKKPIAQRGALDAGGELEERGIGYKSRVQERGGIVAKPIAERGVAHGGFGEILSSPGQVQNN